MEMILLPALKVEARPLVQALSMAVAFVVFALVTFAVILVMDLMECFLHALR